MAKDAYYFSHDANARNDHSVLNIRIKYGMRGYGIYFGIIEMLRETDGYELWFNDCSTIAYDLRENVDDIIDIVKNYGLFAFDGDAFYSPSLKRRMEELEKKREKRSEAGRIAGLASANKRSTNVRRPSTIKVNKSKLNNNKHFIAPSLEEVEKYFKERNTKVDPKVFHAYYEANGWVQGKNKPIKNWKSCLTTWENNGFSNEVKKPTTQDFNKRYEETQRYLKSLEVAA